MKKIYLLDPWLHSSRYYAFLLLPEITGVSWCSEKVFLYFSKMSIFCTNFNWYKLTKTEIRKIRKVLTFDHCSDVSLDTN